MFISYTIAELLDKQLIESHLSTSLFGLNIEKLHYTNEHIAMDLFHVEGKVRTMQ